MHNRVWLVIRDLIWAALFWVILFMVHFGWSAQNEVLLKSQVIVSSDVVRLSDITENLDEKWDVILFPSPMPGDVLQFTRDDLVQILARRRWHGPDISGEKVVIRRKEIRRNPVGNEKLLSGAAVSMAWKLLRDVRKGDVILKKDVVLVKLDKGINKVLLQDSPVGMVASRNLAKGEFLGKNDVRKQYLVKGGSVVKIRCNVSGISVSGVGLAKRSGRYGDIILVKPTYSQKEITARVVGKDLVEVEI